MTFKKLRNIVTRHLPTLARVEATWRFPALYDRFRVRPSSAWLNVTDNCNMRCIMCNQWQETKKNELTTDEWKGVLDDLGKLGVKEVCFGGGEPLLVRDLPSLIKHARARGMDAGITTSGYLLNERKLEELLEAGISNVTISIDGVGEDYERIRRREWKNVANALELLSAEKKKSGLPVILGFVLMKPTMRNYSAVQELARRLDFPVVTSLVDTTPFLFQLPENQNENWIGPSSIPELKNVQRDMVAFKDDDAGNLYNSYADVDFFESYFKDPLQAKIPCTVSQMRIMINGMGEVYGGCWSMGHFGSIREKPLRDIVNSEKYRNTHRDMFYKRCPGCSCGYASSNRYAAGMQWKEILYRALPGRKKSIYAQSAGIAPAIPQASASSKEDEHTLAGKA